MPHQTTAPRKREVTEALWGLFKALRIKLEIRGEVGHVVDTIVNPEIRGEARSLIDLIANLEKVRYFEVFFASYLADYDWGSHNRNPAEVVGEIEPIWNWNRRMLYNIQTFSDCLAGWRRAIATEMDELLPTHGDDFMWFPLRGIPQDAFVYSLFLSFCMRAGHSPGIVPELYADSLSYLDRVSSPERD